MVISIYFVNGCYRNQCITLLEILQSGTLYTRYDISKLL